MIIRANQYIETKKVTGLDAPTASSDSVNKLYVDDRVQNVAFDTITGKPNLVSGSYVRAFNNRSGSVSPIFGDYSASLISFSPTKSIVSTNAQGAIESLEFSKIRYDELIAGRGIKIITGSNGYEFQVTDFFITDEAYIVSGSGQFQYTVPDNCVELTVETIGAGGGGGAGRSAVAANIQCKSAGGGAGGGYVNLLITGSNLLETIGSTLYVTVGAGGFGGTGSVASSGAKTGQNGFNGGNSSVSSSLVGILSIAYGGMGGTGSNENQNLTGSTAIGGTYSSSHGYSYGYNGGTGGDASNGSIGGNSIGTGGGGSGGRFTGAFSPTNGFVGGSGSIVGGTAGAASNVGSGGNGGTPTSVNYSSSLGGSGGGGGGAMYSSNNTSNFGGTGGSGILGGGGGGGGCADISNASIPNPGPGGPGGNGLVRIVAVINRSIYKNIGTGYELLDNSRFIVKTIKTGSNIIISDTGDELILSASIPPIESTGSGFSLVSNGKIKSINTGSNITIVDNGTSLTISSSGGGSSINSVGIGTSLVSGSNSIISLFAGSNISLTPSVDGSTMTIASTGGGGTGSVSGVKRGQYIASSSISSILLSDPYDQGMIDVYVNGFKLVKQTDFTTPDGLTIGFNRPIVSGSIVEYTIFQVGTTASIANVGSGYNIGVESTNSLKSLVAGNGVFISTSSNEITLSSTISSSLNFYVSVTGSDANNGLTTSTTFRTIQYATDYVANINLHRNSIVNIYILPGTYTENIVFAGIGFADVRLTGINSSPVDVTVEGSIACHRSRLLVSNMRVRNVAAYYGGYLSMSTGITFSGSAQSHISVENGGGLVRVNSSYSVTGLASRHLLANGTGQIVYASNVTGSFTGSFAWAFDFCNAANNGCIRIHNYAGVAKFLGGTHTGTKYNVGTGGGIDSNGAGTSYLPGSVAGTSDGTGFYI